MRIILQFVLILGISITGDFLHKYICALTPINIPGNIIGMLILFLLLCLKIVKVNQIKEVSDFFLKHIAFFFLPPSIGIMIAGENIMNQWPLLLTLCILFTIITIIATGWTIQLISNAQRKKK